MGPQPSETIVFIPFGAELLALTTQQFAQALALGRELSGVNHAQPAQAPEPWLDSGQASKLTGVPASWFEDKARQGAIPHLRLGRYYRFRMSDLALALEI